MITALIDRIQKNQEEHADLVAQLTQALAPLTGKASPPLSPRAATGQKVRTVSYSKIPDAIAAKVLPMLKAGKTIRGVAADLGISPTAVARIKNKAK